MFQAMSTAASAIKNQQKRVDTIANNVANINTTAFKGSRLDFKDSLYVNGMVPGPARSPGANQQRGHGLGIAGITTDWRDGQIIMTEGQFDFALEGEGFFSVSDLAGNVFYTRNGNFNISAEADGRYLVNASGLYVLDNIGARIRIPDGAHTINVGPDGIMNFGTPNGDTAATLGVFTFRNLTGLHAVGGSMFEESDASGERFVPPDTIVRQGMLEGSNVNPAEEMTRLMRTQRAFQLASRALTTADEMEGIANNMRR